jgi:hypothetical protein
MTDFDDVTKSPDFAWLHVLHMEFGQKKHRLSFSPENAFGCPARDYSAEYRWEVIRLPISADALEAQAKQLSFLGGTVEVLVVENEKLNALISELEAEKAKLQDLVYRAYQEGFGDAPLKCSEHDNSGNDMAEAWKESYACSVLKGRKW